MNYAIMTVDVEGPKGEGYDSHDPMRNFIWGISSDGNAYGIDMIMNMIESYGIIGIFFVDIAEAWDYGRYKIEEVITHIRSRGHTVGIHIHPNHILDENRFFLFEYSRKEQFEIIKQCTDLYREVTDEFPVYFRAGKYSANYDTLDILNELGYKYDFSEFFGQKWCGIIPPITADKPCRYKKLVEIPVTTFYSFNFAGKKRIDKLDLEMTKFGHKYVIEQLSEGNGNIISLFLHSFSFENWRKNPDNPPFNRKKYKKIRSLVEHVNSNANIQFVRPEQLEELINKGDISVEANRICQVSMKNPFVSYWYILSTSVRIMRTNRKAFLFILSNFAMLIIVIIIIFIVFNNTRII